MLSAITAASLAALAGAPCAHGAAAFHVSIFEAQNDVSYGGGDWDVWVVAATRTDTTGVNAGIDLVDITINSQVDLGIEIQQGSGTGVNTKFSADVDGGQILSNGVNATFNSGPAPAAFGDIVGGTFVGIGQGPYFADYVNNPQITQAGAGGPGTGIDGLVFANNDIGTNTMDTYLNAYLPPHTAGQTGSTLSAAFVSSGTPVSGSLNNGNVKNLNVVAFEPDPGVEADSADGPVPFANIVVPTGTTFNVSGTIGPSGDDPAVPFSITNGEHLPGAMGLSRYQYLGNTNIGTVTMLGSNGSYSPQTVSGISAFGGTAGNLVVNGFNPINDAEIYGLEVSGANSLAEFISDLNANLQYSTLDATAEAPSGSAGAILAGLGDNVEVIFPTGPDSTGPGMTIFSYDLGLLNEISDNGDVTINQITVLPEPSGIGYLVSSAAACLALRRTRRKIRSGYANPVTLGNP